MADANSGHVVAVQREEENADQIEERDVNATATATSVSNHAGSIREKKGRCHRCCQSIFNCLANDAIYGSFFGPHPVSFLCCCLPCKSCCKKTCIRPFVFASVATKTMWFIMLIFVILLSTFFIVPYPRSVLPHSISEFYPCKDPGGELRFVNDNITATCASHGGYFMVYRNFFAFQLLLLLSALTTINMKSTLRSRNRSKLHHGFWMYKYLILFIFMLIAYNAIRVEVGGIFEYVMSWLGLTSALLFSFVELTLFLDMIDPCIITNRSSTSDWADCLYYSGAGVMFIFNLVIIGALGAFYMQYSYGVEEASLRGKICFMHISILFYAILMCIGLVAVWLINRRNSKFKNSNGLLQTMFVMMYFLVLVWNALGNSPEYKARPDNIYRTMNVTAQDGNLDTYFKLESCISGLLAFAALTYLIFWNGPRSQTAPLSLLFNKMVYSMAQHPAIPAVPDVTDTPDPEELHEAIDHMRVWDDEQKGTRYSWSLFFVFMIIGSLTIMMAMCNFSDPWALFPNSSSYPALGMKLLTSLVVCVIYCVTTVYPCPKIFPETSNSNAPVKEESMGGLVEEPIKVTQDAVEIVAAEETAEAQAADPAPATHNAEV